MGPDEAAVKNNSDDEATDDGGDGIHRRIKDSIVMANWPIREVFPIDHRLSCLICDFVLKAENQGFYCPPDDQLSEIH